MSLEEYRNKLDTGTSEEPEPSVNDETDSSDDSDDYQWDCSWHIDPDGYWDSVDERFFGDDKPHDPPLMAVPERLAAEIEVVEDEEFAAEIASMWSFGDAEKHTEVIEVIFNDLSVWRMPAKPLDKDNLGIREHIVEQYVPETIKWEAIIEGENPHDALEEWEENGGVEEKDPEDYFPDWFSDLDDTELSEEDRQWFNRNADWLERIDREVDAGSRDVDVEVESDYGWMEDI